MDDMTPRSSTVVDGTPPVAAAAAIGVPPSPTVADVGTRPGTAVMDERTPHVRKGGGASSTRHRHARPRPRRNRSVLYVAGGLFGASGTGWCLSEVRHDGLHITGLRLPPSVALWGLVGLAGWGMVLLLGELTLFVLAIVNVADPEVHDRCRNLMILWGYVLTLGTPRLFRRLPAQFAQLFADEGAASRSTRDRSDGDRQTSGRPTGRRPRRARPPQNGGPGPSRA
ncbi:hypothetical protein [Actinoallomurus soli]|uniref:hypothetical protein n=1 Tax=Actinoallomurus soli TaxID=2952535 RepID=UPI0020937FEA|nr:hypothetical protein [Actinoallomurus soli]MCO5974207.1 hypothetical protein [Actinoallomurus soli]